MATPKDVLNVGMVGSGFIANFHLQSMIGVRNLRVSGVFSPTAAHREACAGNANGLGLGPCQAYDSLEAMVGADDVDALWICAPNDTRVDMMRAIHRQVTGGRGEALGNRLREAAGAQHR